MKLNIYKLWKPFVVVAMASTLFTACNKDNIDAEPIVVPPTTGSSISQILNDPNYSILKAAVTRAGSSFSNMLADSTAVFTFFAPDNAAFNLSGIPSAAAINTFRPGQLDTLLRYHIVGGQRLTSAVIPTTFPNIQVPSLFVLQAPSASLPPGLRMSLFPSKRGTNLWVNNIPITQADIAAKNGVVHKIAALLSPPSQMLWNRIDTASDLTYLKAAIRRADSGTAAASTLEAALKNAAANLTVFAPTNTAFQQLLTGQITVALMAQGMDQATATATATALASTPGVFANPALSSVLTPQTVRGLVVYHLLGSRAFLVNFPTTPTLVPTLLNTAIPNHPGVMLQATFGATGVTAATVKGLANTTPSNVLVSATPTPAGSSDQHYINGVLHKIDQVLRPQ